MPSSSAILEVNNLSVGFLTESGLVKAVDDISFTVPSGSCVGIVGESGCGKSVTALSILNLLPQPMGRILGGEITFKGKSILKASTQDLYALRGGDIGMIFQEPMSALNPVLTVGAQIAESLILHKGLTPEDARQNALHLLDAVRIPDPEKRLHAYPHELSGGMRQRVLIAIAIACNPSLIIADEPTTALDVTVQAQILDLLLELQHKSDASTLLITHDLGVIAETCDDVLVMYAGRIVEHAPTHELFSRPMHAYTQGLLASIPHIDTPSKSLLSTIPGQVPSLSSYVEGCRFCQRMGRPLDELTTRPPFIEISPGHWIELCPHCTRSLP